MAWLLRFETFFRNIIVYTEFKRCAGHSKWSNIKHTKIAMDLKKNYTAQEIIKKLTFAAFDKKTTDPNKNPAIAKIIVEGTKRSVPMTTITNALKKIQIKLDNIKPIVLTSRGPSEVILILQMINNERNLITINSILKEAGYSICSLPSKGLIKETGFILTEANDFNEDKIIEDAILVGAENVEIIQEDDGDFFQFTCSPDDIPKIQTQLEKLNYEIFETKIKYIPQMLVSLTDEDLKIHNDICDKLNKVNTIVEISSNIA